MKLSDFVADFIADLGVKYVFLYSGGAIVHTIDSVARHPKLKFICPQHEQGGTAAADAYARVTENIGCMLTTSGPGATNTLTSICNAYFDSIPILVITGQVASFRIKKSKKLRQFGFQETDVISIFKSVTKYAVQLKRASDILYELQKAVYMAKQGRPGPVLIDIPDNLQREDINPKKLRKFIPNSVKKTNVNEKIKKLASMIRTAERPILVYGAGIRISKTKDEAIAFARKLGLPVVLTWGAMDILPFDDPINFGGLGVSGPRGGNFMAQTSDLIIAMGTRLSSMITGGKQDMFAPHTKKVMVDIDKEEFKKFSNETVRIDLKIHTDLKDFFKQANTHTFETNKKSILEYKQTGRKWMQKYPTNKPEYFMSEKQINAYVFIKTLSHVLEDNDIILTDAGGNLTWTMQAFETKLNQRLFSAWNHSPMGYSVPAAIGAAVASRKNIYVITGDGGLMMCIQELGTIRRHDLPIKIFIFNNHGHGIQKQTMDTWLNSRYTVVDEKTGLWFPDYQKVAKVFEMPYLSINSHAQIEPVIKKAKSIKGPVLINVEIYPDQKIVPFLKFGSGIEDLGPKLAPDEVSGIMDTFKIKINHK